jgi:HJR/Mrr/RecB family endonuclease
MSKNAWKVSRQVLRDVRTTQVVVMYARRSARKIVVVSSLITVVLKFLVFRIKHNLSSI